MVILESSSPRLAAQGAAARLGARLSHWLSDRSDNTLAQRMASAAFLIRVGSAALAYVVQVLLARWMGSYEFGVFAYVWTWVLILGSAVDLGLSTASQRFIPDYVERGTRGLLRGYVYGSRWIAFGIGTLAAIAGVGAVSLLEPWLDHYTIVPLYIACLTLPICGVMQAQDGIARSYNWVNVAMLPPYIFRQVLLIALMAGAYFMGLPQNATTAIGAAAIALWLTGIGQTMLLNRKLGVAIEKTEPRYEPRRWLATAIPMFAVDGMYLLLLNADIIILSQFRAPDEIAIYYAATKTLALVSFVHFSVSAATAHKYTEYHVAGDREKLRRFLADSIRWTFWPSLAATIAILVCGWPLLWLFGERFVAGYDVMFILSIGMLARAAVGPGERFLNMLGEQRACMLAMAAAVGLNLLLCFLLIPRYGVEGAALATSSAFIVESILLFVVAKRRLGFYLFAWGRKEHR